MSRKFLAPQSEESTDTTSGAQWQASSWQRADPRPSNLVDLPVTADEVTAFQQQPIKEQARALAWFRLKGSPNPDDRVPMHTTLKEQLRPQLDQLESDPEAIATFQSSFVAEMLGTLKPETIQSIESIVRGAYQNAVEQGVDAASLPDNEADYEAWALKRGSLDRPATRAVQALLTPRERTLFDQRLMGIMGIDIGDGTWHRFMDSTNAVVFPSEGE